MAGSLKAYARPVVRRKAVLTERSSEVADGALDFLVVNREHSAERIARRAHKMRAAAPMGGAMEVVHKLVAGVFELPFEVVDHALGDGTGRQAPVVSGFRVAPRGCGAGLRVRDRGACRFSREMCFPLASGHSTSRLMKHLILLIFIRFFVFAPPIDCLLPPAGREERNRTGHSNCLARSIS